MGKTFRTPEETMRVSASLGMLAALVSHAACADVVRHVTVPEPLRGTWATGSDNCNKAGSPVIVLSAKSYVSSDANCAVDWIDETAGAQGPVYSAHLRCANTPKSAQTAITNVIFLRKDPDKLSIGADFSKLEIYQRCPADAPATTR
jgi:hypothetical protein